MDIQQLWLIISTIIFVLILTVLIVMTLIIIIHIINNILLKNKFNLKGEKAWYEIAIAGAIILATGQLVGSLCGVVFPIWFGSDISDYCLSSVPINYSYEYNSTLNKYFDNNTNQSAPANLIFISKIYANNTHPLRKYNQQIYLNIVTPSGINATTFDYTIKPNGYTYLYVYTYNKNKLYPGRYILNITGEGGDGKSRECKVFLDVYSVRSIIGPNKELTTIRSTENLDLAKVWNLTVINNATELNMNWGIIPGFTFDQLHVSPGHSQTIRIQTYPLNFKFFRNNTSVTISYDDMSHGIIVPCERQIKLMMDNESIEIGKVFTMNAKRGSTHTLRVSL